MRFKSTTEFFMFFSSHLVETNPSKNNGRNNNNNNNKNIKIDVTNAQREKKSNFVTFLKLGNVFQNKIKSSETFVFFLAIRTVFVN